MAFPKKDQPDQKHHIAVRRALTVLRDGLGPYLIDTYRKIYGVRWEAEFRDCTRSFKTLDFSSDEALLATLDTQGWLDLVVKKRDVFTRRLGRAAVAYADELLEARNSLAHDHAFSADEVRRVYDTTALLLGMIGAQDLAHELRLLLSGFDADAESAVPGELRFSRQIRAQMALLGKTISELTEDQYRIIEWLRGQRRASVSGCAGSGKTLVAMEKAIRLDRAGLATLVLCHSPFLADHLRHLASATRVRVFDFAEWVAILLGKTARLDGTWVQYEEPTESELSDAFDRLTDSVERYDAVIIDESQDFRETWWILVEHALLDPAKGIFYVFHDDNQALLPQRSQYPVTEAPFSMSKNCRNAGAIFEVVRQLHPQAPGASALLAGSGVARRTLFSGLDELGAVRVAIVDASALLSPDRMVVLTNEPVVPEKSVLNGLRVPIPPRLRWQDVVMRCLMSLDRRLGRRTRGSAGPPPMIALPTLSNQAFPTDDDIQAVCTFARRVGPLAPHPPIGVSWRLDGDNLSLNGLDRPGSAIGHFASESWADGLPRPTELVVDADPQGQSPLTVRLWTTATFKGLESDGVIFFVRKAQHDFDAHLYVGMSRARMYLNVVASSSVYSPVLQRLQDVGCY